MNQKLEIDNSGRGNCMYYAYSISLMCFLRSKGHKETTDQVLAKLQLVEEEKNRLYSLLSDASDESFTSDEIKNIIEPILGPATRSLGARRTRQEFLDDPMSSPIFTSAYYGLEYAFKQQLNLQQSPLAMLLDNQFDNREFTSAEIYQVTNIQNRMKEFAARQVMGLIDAFDRQWQEKLNSLSDKSENNLIFHRNQLLTTLIRTQTVAFYNEHDHAELDRYVQHLDTNYQCATDETLMTLHRAIVGEKMSRNPITKAIETSHDTKISIHIFKNGHPASPINVNETPDIILNHRGYGHWTSLIPVSPNDLNEREMRNHALELSGFNTSFSVHDNFSYPDSM